MGSYLAGDASRGLAQGQQSGNKALADMLMGGDGQAAMANPYSADDAMKMKMQDRQQAIAEQRQQNDPYRQLQMEKLRKDIAQAGTSQTRVGLQPIYGRDEQGNVVVLQPSASGDMVQAKPPQGVTIDPGLAAGLKAQAGAQGKSAGAAAVLLPKAKAIADEAKKVVEKLRTHPGRSEATGWGSLLPDVAFTNRPGRGFIDLMKQAQGGAFLQSFEMLKGGGPITEIEGQKATEAIARMNRAQTKEDFDDALNDYIGAVDAGYRKLEAQAASGPSGAMPQPTMAPQAPKTDMNLPTLQSPAEASKLPSGTRFKTPDGRVMEVP
jgi:hypothetical protein